VIARTELREGIAATVAGLPATLALTVRYESGPITMSKLTADLNRLQMRLDRKLFGRDFTKSPVRSSYWAVAESKDSNPHAHCGWSLPQPYAMRVMQFIPAIWLDLAKGGTVDVQPLTSQVQWARYAVKAMQDSASLIISPQYGLELRPPVTT